MVWLRKIFPIVLLNLLCSSMLLGEEGQSSSDWGVIERERGSDDLSDDSDAQTAAEQDDVADSDEPFDEDEEIDYSPIVETVTKKTVEDLGRKLVGGEGHDCLRCVKKNRLALQVLGAKTLVGVTGITMTRHFMSRTSLQGGVGYGFGGFNLGVAALHYFRENNSLHLLTGLNASIKMKEDERDLEGLWILFGIGSHFNTQVGISYGVDFGITMAVLENVFNANTRLCFGVLSQSSCREKWRIVPYITPIKIGYAF